MEDPSPPPASTPPASPPSASSRVNRRSFLNRFLGLSVTALFAAVFYPIVRYLSPPRVPEAAGHQVDAGPTNDPALLEKGFKIVRLGAEPVIVVRAAEGDYRAFTATCTHLDCVVEYRNKEQLLWCNCHNGQFDLNGRNVGGPPPRPLTPLKVDLAPQGPGRPSTIIVSRA
jgi:Rieske Fe-S protein